MLRLQRIFVTHFKNYRFSPFEFNKNVVGISGLNGTGKTNLLDAIYCLAFTKSYFGLTDTQNIRHSENFLVVNGSFKKEYYLNSDDLDNNLVDVSQLSNGIYLLKINYNNEFRIIKLVKN